MKQFLIPVVILLFFYSCKNDDIKPEDHFSKTYYDSARHNNYFPVDFQVLDDKEYLVLSLLKKDTVQSTFPGIYVMRTDKYGKALWNTSPSREFVNAVPQLFKNGNDYIFFGMHATSLETVLFKVNPGEQQLTEVKRFPEITYPLYSSRDSSGNYLLLGFNSVSRSSTLTKLNSNFTITWQKEFPIIEDVVEKIIYHLTRTGKHYPFFTGSINNGSNPSMYYYNGFSNFTFSFSFINPQDGNQRGLINGFRYDGGVSSLLPLSDNNFALSRFYYTDEYFLPVQALQTTSSRSINDYKGIWMPELENSLNVYSCTVNLNNQLVTLVVAPTRSNTVGMYFYDQQTGKNLLTKFIGDRFPIEPSAVRQDAQGAIILLCRIYESGKYPRISLIKFAGNEFKW